MKKLLAYFITLNLCMVAVFAGNDYDPEAYAITDEQKQQILQYQADWKVAFEKSDEQGMKQAHINAQNVRFACGYIANEDGYGAYPIDRLAEEIRHSCQKAQKDKLVFEVLNQYTNVTQIDDFKVFEVDEWSLGDEVSYTSSNKIDLNNPDEVQKIEIYGDFKEEKEYFVKCNVKMVLDGIDTFEQEFSIRID